MNHQKVYYQKRAQEYELVYQKPERQDDLYKIKEFLVTQFKNKSILEIACGTGYWTEILAQKAKSIHATDINDEVLLIAKSKSYSQNNVGFEQLDLWELNTPPLKFEGLFGGFIWSHIPKEKLAPFLNILTASLKPSSQMIFLDNKFVKGSSTPLSRIDENGNTYQIRTLISGEEFEVLKNFPDYDEINNLLEHYGADFEWIDYTYYWIANIKVTNP